MCEPQPYGNTQTQSFYKVGWNKHRTKMKKSRKNSQTANSDVLEYWNEEKIKKLWSDDDIKKVWSDDELIKHW